MSADDEALWQSLSDASDVMRELVHGMPGPGEGFVRLPESNAELAEGIALLEKAIELLERAHERETPRYEAWSRSKVETRQ